MEKEVAGTFSFSREDMLNTPRAVAVIDDGTVVVETLSTPYRYYVVPALTGFAGIYIFELIAARIGSGGLIWGAAGAVLGVLVGMLVALDLQKRKHEKTMASIGDGKRELSNDIIVKKGKVNQIETEDNGSRKSLHVVTPKHDFELLGTEDEIERVRDALT